MLKGRLYFSVLLTAVLVASGSALCDTSDDDELDVLQACTQVYEALEEALISDKGSLYRLRKTFFPSPSANVVLQRVKYYITFAPDETDLNGTCSMTNENSTLINTTATLEYTYGWSQTGIFTVLHPLALNLFQLQLPFVLMRLTNLIADTTYDPEVNTFLWDGTSNLPTVHLYLHINKLNCTPSNDVFNSSLRELTSTLKAYAKYQRVPPEYDQSDPGYTLEDEMINGQDASFTILIIGIFYFSIISILVLLISILFGITLFTTFAELKMFSWLLFLMVLFNIIAFLAEFVEMCIVGHHLGSVGGVLFIGKVFSLFLPFLLFLLTICYIYCNMRERFCAILQVFFIIINFAMFAQLITTSFLPAFLLLLIYPIKVVSLFAYIVTLVFSLALFGTIWDGIPVYRNQQKASKLPFYYHCAMLSYFIYFFAFLFVMVFLLVITKAAIISPGTYGVISLLPSVVITAGIWLLKKKILEKRTNEDQPPGNELQDQAQNENQNQNQNQDQDQNQSRTGYIPLPNSS